VFNWRLNNLMWDHSPSHFAAPMGKADD
jgi:hypothetical protein